MKKLDIANYLVSLNALLEAQSKSAHSTVSQILAAEYNLHWEMLKTKITEDYNETRQSPDKSNDGNKDGADKQSNLSGKS